MNLSIFTVASAYLIFVSRFAFCSKVSWSDLNLEDLGTTASNNRPKKPFLDFFSSSNSPGSSAIPPSISTWETLENKGRFSVLSMSIDHHKDSSWYMAALHRKHSIGWNRTAEKPFYRKPYACTIKFIGVGLEKETLDGYQEGGTGYLTISFQTDQKKQAWHGFDKNETNKLHCYYSTNKDTGSEFIDTPKTLGLAVMCPVTLDDEMGPFLFHRTLVDGHYCYPLTKYPAEVELHLRPTKYRSVGTSPSSSAEIMSEFVVSPAGIRTTRMRDILLPSTPSQLEHSRRHAVCTVQTFMNEFSGPMLYMFVSYYQLMGWRVLVFDRFGMHYDYVKELLHLPGVDYYPFTVYQLAQPSKYNSKYLQKQGTELKSFYKMEVNWGYSSKKLADTADQDADKTRTYDFVRLEHSYLDTILYADADELFYCPQASSSISEQRAYHKQIHDEFITRGLEEMRYVRIPYSGLAPPNFVNNQQNRSNIDFTNHTGHCMINAYQRRCLLCMAQCWSMGTAYDNFPKSADLAGVCPFHYNHWSCDGMKGGGRDWTKVRCRCKVGLDMQNGYDYHPVLKKCHLMHFNDNKYRFQSKRTKHIYDKGDVTVPSPLVPLLQEANKAPVALAK